MYELKRQTKITSSVKIGDEEISVQLDVGVAGNDFNLRYAKIVNAEIALKNAFADKTITPERFDAAKTAYGDAVIALMELLFGVTGAAKIITFYEGDYIELLTMIIPFVKDDVVPAVKKYRDDNLAAYKRAGGHKR